MAVVILPNERGEDSAPMTAPLREETGTPFPFEMVFDGRAARAYGDSFADLIDVLIPGYLDMDDQERLEARLDYALRVQVVVQAEINRLYDLTELTAEEQAVLMGSRETPPELDVWGPEVPIVLVDAYYRPFTDLPRTASLIADVKYPPNILWLSPLTEEDLLVSLHAIGWVDVRAYMGDLA